LLRVSKNQIIWGANHFISKIPYDSSCWIVWDKLNGENDFADCELAWTSFNTAVRKFKFQWQGMIQGYGGNKRNNEIRIHPNQKPLALGRWLIQNYAKSGDVILDTHSGSGCFSCSAYLEGFDFISCENDEFYHKSSTERLDTLRSQGTLF
jgi:site-specific DNA-methyltransferase (adenine-specific)